ncbi:MAG: hypothetical protein Q9167_007206 [Letrouitia subvulpina]
MDPLSITAGTIAIIGAVRQTTKALQGLRAIRQAPTEIQSLLEEVVDLDTLLKQIQNDSGHRSCTVDSPASYDQNGLDRQVRRASAKLGELTSLLESHSTSQRIAGIERGHFSWRRGRRTANGIREDLKLIRMNITASLGALSVSTIERNQTTVERIEKKYDETIRQLTASIGNLTLITPSFDPPTFEAAVGKGNQGYSFDHPFESPDRCFRAADRPSNKFGNMTRLPKATSTPAELAWDHILSGSLSEDTACQVAGIFSNTDFLQSRQFTILHKIVLKLIPKDLKTELEYSTKELDATDSSGHTCASWAAKRGDDEALQILLDCGADPNIPDIHGNTPLHHVRNIDCCNILLRYGANASATNSYGHTTLHTICRGDGQFLLLRRLIDAGVDLNIQDHRGETVAMTAVWNKHQDCAQYLLKNGADLEVANISGDRLIHLAIMVNFHPILELLLDRGARTDCPNAFGETVLHFAARLSDSKAVRILSHFGASGVDVDAPNHEKKNARHYLEEREADEQDPDFRKHFEELLSGVVSTSQTEADVLSIADQIASLDMGKETVVSCYTPLTTDDEDDDYEDTIGRDRSEHGPVIYYDAVEELCQVEEIVA